VRIHAYGTTPKALGCGHRNPPVAAAKIAVEVVLPNIGKLQDLIDDFR
jgi:hypothetical protein